MLDEKFSENNRFLGYSDKKYSIYKNCMVIILYVITVFYLFFYFTDVKFNRISVEIRDLSDYASAYILEIFLFMFILMVFDSFRSVLKETGFLILIFDRQSGFLTVCDQSGTHMAVRRYPLSDVLYVRDRGRFGPIWRWPYMQVGRDRVPLGIGWGGANKRRTIGPEIAAWLNVRYLAPDEIIPRADSAS